MIGSDPYGIRHAVRPGYGEPEPVAPVSTRDPQWAIDRCLGCGAVKCFGTCEAGDGLRTRPTQTERTRLRDEKIRDMIRAGRNNDAICEELGISMSTLNVAKRRLRKAEEIP